MSIRTRAVAVGVAAAATLALTAAPALAQKTIKVTTSKTNIMSFTGMPKTLKAGTYTFAYTNSSGIDHNLKIGTVSTPNFASGTKKITVTLKKGTVAYICSVPGHAQAGMKGTIKVT